MGTLKHFDHNQRIYIQHGDKRRKSFGFPRGSSRPFPGGVCRFLEILHLSGLSIAQTEEEEVSICDSPCPHHACVNVNIELIWLRGSLRNEAPPRRQTEAALDLAKTLVKEGGRWSGNKTNLKEKNKQRGAAQDRCSPHYATPTTAIPRSGERKGKKKYH